LTSFRAVRDATTSKTPSWSLTFKIKAANTFAYSLNELRYAMFMTSGPHVCTNPGRWKDVHSDTLAWNHFHLQTPFQNHFKWIAFISGFYPKRFTVLPHIHPFIRRRRCRPCKVTTNTSCSGTPQHLARRQSPGIEPSWQPSCCQTTALTS